MIWTQSDGYHEAEYKGAHADICRTGALPQHPIPKRERWTLTICGPYYFSITGPTIKGLKAKAKRVIDALEEIG